MEATAEASSRSMGRTASSMEEPPERSISLKNQEFCTDVVTFFSLVKGFSFIYYFVSFNDMGTVLGYAVDEFNIFSQFCKSALLYTSSTVLRTEYSVHYTLYSVLCTLY